MNWVVQTGVISLSAWVGWSLIGMNSMVDFGDRMLFVQAGGWWRRRKCYCWRGVQGAYQRLPRVFTVQHLNNIQPYPFFLHFLPWLMEYILISSFRTEIWERSKITIFLISWHSGGSYFLTLSLIHTQPLSPTSSIKLSSLSWVTAVAPNVFYLPKEFHSPMYSPCCSKNNT